MSHSVTVTQPIDATVSRIWDTIAEAGVLERAHPFVEKNPVQEWKGVGSRDSIHYFSGLVYHRDFTWWEPGVGYDLGIGQEQSRETAVRWRIEQKDGSNCLSITISNIALEAKPMLHTYLESVTRGFDHLITTGTPVGRNRFGPLAYFSP